MINTSPWKEIGDINTEVNDWKWFDVLWKHSCPLFWLQPYGTGVFILEASQKLSDTFTVHFYTGNRKISFFHKYFKPINTWLFSMKKCMQTVQTMVFTNDGWWVYKILQNYWQLLMQYKLTIQVSFLVHNLYKNNTLELFYILTTF